MGATDNLRQAADAVSARAKVAGCASFDGPVRRLHQAAQRVGLAWCGSWLPGMANLYGQALQPQSGGLPRPPELSGSGRVGWVQWTPDEIRGSIHQAAGQPNVQELLSHAARSAVCFDEAKSNSVTLLAAASAGHSDDTVLRALWRDAQELRLVDHDSLLDSWRPSSKPALGQGADPSRGWDVPAHLSEIAAIEAIRSPLIALQALASMLRRANEQCRSLQAAQLAQKARATALAGSAPPHQPAFAGSAAPLRQLVTADSMGRPRRVAGAHAP